MSHFTIGADPELFLRSLSTGKLVSAVGKIGGSKHDPLPISQEGHAIQEDNVAVEFNIPPANNADSFVKDLNFVLDNLKERVSKLGLVFTHEAAASFPEEELQTPEAQMFGCEPDFDAWDCMENDRPCASDQNLRSCGGHVHVGTTLNKIQIVRAMDIFLGVPSVVLDKDIDRRKLYGRAGAHRPKSYGVEYRTLSNFWIWSDDLKKWVFEQTNKAVSFVESGNTLPDDLAPIVRSCINNGDMEAYEYLRRTYG